MKIFLVLFFSFSVNAKPLYGWTQDKLIEVFNVEYRDDITFGQVYYLDSFDCVDKEAAPVNDYTVAVLNNFYQKEYNDIWILKSPPERPFIKKGIIDEAYMQSALVHEFAHFFTKKAGFNEEFDGITKVYDRGMIEAIAYFIQDLWLKETTGHGLLFYYPDMEEKDFRIDPTFAFDAKSFYRFDYKNFLVNAIDYFKEEAPNKFEMAVTRRDYDFGYRIALPNREKVEADKPPKNPGEAFNACFSKLN